MARHRIAVIAGDGIGKEVMPEGLRVLEAAGTKFGIDYDFNRMHSHPTIVGVLAKWFTFNRNRVGGRNDVTDSHRIKATICIHRRSLSLVFAQSGYWIMNKTIGFRVRS